MKCEIVSLHTSHFSLLPFLHLLPHRAATVGIEPDQLLLSCVDDVDASSGTFDVDKGQADGDHFVRMTRVTRHILRPNRLVGRLAVSTPGT